jgi:hypothetical protein
VFIGHQPHRQRRQCQQEEIGDDVNEGICPGRGGASLGESLLPGDIDDQDEEDSRDKEQQQSHDICHRADKVQLIFPF